MSRLVEQTRLYVAGDAILMAKPNRFPTLRPIHDALHQFALGSGLARWVTVTYRKRIPENLRDIYETTVLRANWWPGNAGSRPAPNVISFRADSFGNDWTKIRTALEPSPTSAPIWSNDPALFVEHPSGGFVCRTACIGHEGWVYYLAYDQEKEWVSELERAGLRVSETGTKAYSSIIQETGRFASGDGEQHRAP